MCSTNNTFLYADECHPIPHLFGGRAAGCLCWMLCPPHVLPFPLPPHPRPSTLTTLHPSLASCLGVGRARSSLWKSGGLKHPCISCRGYCLLLTAYCLLLTAYWLSWQSIKVSGRALVASSTLVSPSGAPQEPCWHLLLFCAFPEGLVEQDDKVSTIGTSITRQGVG